MDDFELNISDIDKICRVCLKEKPDMKPINSKLKLMLQSIADIKINGIDELPKLICTDCVLQVDRAYTFRQLIRKSESMLMHFFMNKSNNGTFIVGDDKNETNNQDFPPKLTERPLPTENPSSNKVEHHLMKNEDGDEVSLDMMSCNNILSNDEPQTKNGDNLKLTKQPSDATDNNSDFIKQEKSCEITTDFTNSKSHLLKHMKNHGIDATIKKHLCSICGKLFESKYKLIRHNRTHTGERPFICDICDTTFAQLYHIRVHMLSHITENPYKCKFCDKDYTKSHSLYQHISKHHSRSDGQHSTDTRNKCGICGKLFQTPYRLNRHNRIHTGERPFKCDICNATFNQASTVKLHMRSHTKERPYKCQFCGNNFTQSSSLYLHIRNQHTENV